MKKKKMCFSWMRNVSLLVASACLWNGVAVAHSADVPLPPGIKPELIQPKTGAALEKANMSLPQILKAVAKPDYLPPANAKDSSAATAKRIALQIQTLRASLKKKPGDTAAIDQLVKLAIVESDNAQAALPYVEKSADTKARLHVPLAAKPINELKESELLDVGVWYRSLAAAANDRAKVSVLKRAKRYLVAYLKVHKAADIQSATAKVSIQRIDEELARLDPSTAGAKPNGASSEPPRSVQRAYAWAREDWKTGKPFRAINRLEAANNIAPNQPQIVRLLGLIHFFDTGNRVRGAQYLKQAMRLQPNDPEVAFHLGRYEALHLRNWSNAIPVLAHTLSMDLSKSDLAIAMLSRHYLARGLLQSGYERAAVAQFEKVLSMPPRFSQSSRLLREVALFVRNQAASWQQLGDAYNRLGDSAKATRAYQIGLAAKPVNPVPLASRLIFVQLRAKQVSAAIDTAIKAIRNGKGNAASLALLSYLVEAGASGKDGNELAARMNKIYADLGKPASLIIAIASVQPASNAVPTLEKHLAAKPGDREVFEKLLALLIPKEGKREVGKAIAITAKLIKSLPSVQDRYSSLLLDAGRIDPKGLAAAFKKLPKAQQGEPAVLLMHAMALTAAGRGDEALKIYQQAFKADPNSTAAKVRYIEMLIERKQFDQAAKALNTLKSDADGKNPKLAMLRVRVLRETGKVKEALVLINQLIAKGRPLPSLLVEKAKLQVADGDVPGAQRTLDQGTVDHPTAEILFQELSLLLQTHQPADAAASFRRMLERAFRQIPNSRFVRLIRGQQLLRASQFKEVERLGRELLREKADDSEAIDLLAEALDKTGKAKEADELIARLLKQKSDDVDALRVAHSHYARTENKQKRYEVLQLLIPKLFKGFERNRQMVALHLEFDEVDKAIAQVLGPINAKAELKEEEFTSLLRLLGAALTQAKRDADIEKHFTSALKSYPQFWAEGMFEWAMLSERTGNKTKSEKQLASVIKKSPGHVAANNALGYSWADQGINLPRAKKMIEIAIKKDPNNSAYLDSIGWVNYKLRKFDEAVRWLERSRVNEGGDHPVILDHLGDALYRAGRQVEALQWWMRAQTNMDEFDIEQDAELKKLTGELRSKINAVRTAKEPPLADAPGPVGTKSKSVDPKKDDKPKPEKQD
jgi:tetratricopeptide (TPR) repeat protein